MAVNQWQVVDKASRNPHTANTTEINHSDVPIRLFKSDFLEFFTHISPVVVLIIWVPVDRLLPGARDHSERAERRLVGLHPGGFLAGPGPLDLHRVHDAPLRVPL